MLTVTQKGRNRIDLELSGKLDTDEMKIALDEIINKSEGIEHGKMLYRIHNFNIPTMGALGVELKNLPGLYRTFKEFDRVAVVSDKKWIRRVSEFEGALLPGIDIRAFDVGNENEAEAWLVEEATATENL